MLNLPTFHICGLKPDHTDPNTILGHVRKVTIQILLPFNKIAEWVNVIPSMHLYITLYFPYITWGIEHWPSHTRGIIR